MLKNGSIIQAGQKIDSVTSEGIETIGHLAEVSKHSVKAFEEIFALMQNIQTIVCERG